MKYTIALTLLVATATALPRLQPRDKVSDLVDQFNALNDNQQANFLEQVSDANGGNVNVESVNDDGSQSNDNNDVLADVNAFAQDDGEANVAVKDSDDVNVAADVQALDDGTVNVNINGLEDVIIKMLVAARNGATANATLDQGSTKGWGLEGGATCAESFTSKRIVASMGFCVKS